MTANNYTYNATVTRVVDGDSLIAHFDIGFHITIDIEVRVYGMNAPEHGTTPGDTATTEARRLLPDGSQIVARTHKPGTNAGLEKYGRWLAEVTLPDGTSFADRMIAGGFAVPYLL